MTISMELTNIFTEKLTHQSIMK